MYHSNGNYEAFARPKKPQGVDQKSAYLVGSGLASLSAAAFLVRDGQMKGENIHILEELPLAGGSLDADSLFVEVVKWKTTSNVYGTYSDQSLH